MGGTVDCCTSELHLTARDIDLLVALARGAASDAIARAQHISVHTVNSRLSWLLRKLRVGNRAELVARATHLRLIDCTVWPPRAGQRRCVPPSEAPSLWRTTPLVQGGQPVMPAPMEAQA